MNLPSSLAALNGLSDQLRARLASVDEGVLIHDQSGAIVAVSPGAVRLLGAEADQLLGRRTPLEVCRAWDTTGTQWREDQCPATACMTTGESQRQIVLRIDRPDGRLIWLSFDALPLDGEGGVRYGVANLFEDVTERHLAEATRTRLLDEAREALRSRDAFLAVAAHELKTPLTALQLHLHSVMRGLEGGTQDPKLLANKLKATSRQADRINHLVDVLLDVARISSGRLELNRTSMDLAELVKDVVERNADELDRSGCKLSTSFDDTVMGEWDIIRLEQVITNLLSNAAKYGHGRPVEVTVARDGQRARLAVRDAGIGISREDQQRVFGRFERAVSDTHYGGLGLGLWIVREIVEAHGGTIQVSSQPGTGSEFIVELPLRR